MPSLKRYPKLTGAKPKVPRQRAAYVKGLLKTTVYAQSMGVNDPDTAVVDLLADLMHFAREYGVDIWDAVERARRHFYAEQEDE